MIVESEILELKTEKHLGLWICNYQKGSPPRLKLRFTPENHERLKKLDDLTQLVVSIDMISAGEFKRNYLSHPEFSIELSQEDTQPTTWRIQRRY